MDITTIIVAIVCAVANPVNCKAFKVAEAAQLLTKQECHAVMSEAARRINNKDVFVAQARCLAKKKNVKPTVGI